MYDRISHSGSTLTSLCDIHTRLNQKRLPLYHCCPEDFHFYPFVFLHFSCRQMEVVFSPLLMYCDAFCNSLVVEHLVLQGELWFNTLLINNTYMFSSSIIIFLSD